MITMLLAISLVIEPIPAAYRIHVYSTPGLVMDIEYTDYFSGTMPNTWAVLRRITNTTGHTIVPVPADLSHERSKFFRAVSQ